MNEEEMSNDFTWGKERGRKEILDKLRKIRDLGDIQAVLPNWLDQFIKENTPDEKEAK